MDALPFFPYATPYAEQAQFITDVQQAYKEGKRIFLLEAPTGFGKTAAILAALLPLNQKMFYFTRTHAQMQQVINEVRKINQKFQKNQKAGPVTAVVRGSRNKLCLSPKIREMHSSDAIESCFSNVWIEKSSLSDFLSSQGRGLSDNLQKQRKQLFCHLKSRLVKIPTEISPGMPRCLGIVDLIHFGERDNICPYYLSKLLSEKQDISIGSYEYLFLDESYANSIVLFDEGHNFEPFSTRAFSCTLSRSMINAALTETQLSDHDSAYVIEGILNQIKVAMDRFTLKDEPLIFSRNDLFDFLSKAGLDQYFRNSVISLVEDIIKFHKDLMTSKTKSTTLEQLFCYRIYAFFQSISGSSPSDFVAIINGPKGKERIRWLCLNPALGFNLIRANAPQSIVMMSGTLAPLEGLRKRLDIQIEDAFQKPYSSIISRQNILILSVSQGPRKMSLTTKYEVRNNRDILEEYGLAVKDLSKVIPNGCLVFFPSYGVMQRTLHVWENSNILFEIKQQSEVFLEARGEIASTLRRFKDSANRKKAILFAVCRGKLAEGADFKDKTGRAVIMIGLPYPDISDPKVKAQRLFWDRKSKGFGKQWYIDSALREVNQTLGRVWRHCDDFAVGILLDYRYKWSQNREGISNWLKERFISLPNKIQWNEILKIIMNFFHDKN
ncbi:MAG: helicase C-terminal domain-containing protein [Candidatus Hodarchaeota archaeon]